VIKGDKVQQIADLAGITIIANSNCCITDCRNLFKWQLLCWYTSAIGRAHLLFKMMPQVLLSPCE